MKISYSYGIVDLLNYGHMIALKNAAMNSDLNIFGLVSDESSKEWFGTHVSNQNERRVVLEGIKYIDEVLEQQTFDPLDNLKKIHASYPDAVITLYVGTKWKSLSAKMYLESIGGQVIYSDYYTKLSPQSILNILGKNEGESDNIMPKSSLLSTKANTLLALKPLVIKSRIEDLFIVTYREFMSNEDNILNDLSVFFSGNKIVIRSSSKREDSFSESNAGHFTSILGVDSSDISNVRSSIKSVFESYGDSVDDDEQVLIQKQTNDVVYSGVVFTRDIQHNRHYYVVNYDDSGSTDSVTSGMVSKTFWLSSSASKESVPPKWLGLMEAIWEIESILSGILLDVEFAITGDQIVIFQVRPLAAAYKYDRNYDGTIIDSVKNRFISLYQQSSVNGFKCYSDMSFWNPAEIIGDNPKNLDYSLYREIITKRAWNEGLLPIGYRPVLSELMYRFGNKPYISVERSFKSLMPKSISDELAKKLEMYYIKKLLADLSSHDKIEFEISHNCFDFSTSKRLAQLLIDGFTVDEIHELEVALKTLTINIINSYQNLLSSDLKDLRNLEFMRYDIIDHSKNISDFRILARLIRIIIESIEKFGTPQFSRQARCAFIAKSLSKSLVSEGYISTVLMDQFMSSIITVAVDYNRDYSDVVNGILSKEKFFSTYGHLRAGTYNILSPRYDQIENFFSENLTNTKICEQDFSNVDIQVKDALFKAINDENLTDKLDSDVVLSFLKTTTEQREYFKFIFTKSLSLALELIKQLGHIIGICDEDLCYLELQEIYSAENYTDIDSLKEFWTLVINRRKEIYKLNSQFILPDVIKSCFDFDFIENVTTRPNFITEEIVVGDVVMLQNYNDLDVSGKIVVIEKADPGYDWIFSKRIKGLITKYGGAASHMAIRCAEFKVPAAIGCGANLFDYVLNSKTLIIDCKQEKIAREV